MGTISVTAFISIDGVMQGPGSPQEDPSGGFTSGGWVVPFIDEVFGDFMTGVFATQAGFLLGRATYDIFASHWPKVTDPADLVATKLNTLPKYVVTTRPGLDWGPVTAVPLEGIARLKASVDGELQVHGSPQLARSLLGAGLVDSMNLLVFPVILGSGKRLFGAEGTSGWALTSSQRSGTGLVINQYRRAGAVPQGTVPPPQ
ncbi:MAG: dihydrofolate reductase family protein [Anaeromyxobacter sp.]|nr:dihydrofolate reductase family protein [Anaeromyxobacter sp.]